MKVKAMIMLDEDVKRDAQMYLRQTGMSLSGFVNLLLAQYVEEMKGGPEMSKPVKDMTIEEFGKLAAFWLRKAS